MVAKPMQGDGPAVYEAEPPYTLAELVATCEDDHDLMLALAMARAWPEGVPERDLEPWQRIGPDVLWMVARRDLMALWKVVGETTRHLAVLPWVVRKNVPHSVLVKASCDAVERLVYRKPLPQKMSDVRKETYLELRAEAVAFLVNCMAVAEVGVEIALGKRPEPRTGS